MKHLVRRAVACNCLAHSSSSALKRFVLGVVVARQSQGVGGYSAIIQPEDKRDLCVGISTLGKVILAN